jgi:hypothetical protein
MDFSIVENDKYLIRIYRSRNYIEYSVKRGVTIDVSDLLEGKRMITAHSPGVKFYVLAEGVDFFTFTQPARELSATKEYSDNTLAIAFYTTNVSLILLGEMYNKINKPAVRTRIFKDRSKAREWLEKVMEKDRDNLFY